MGIIKSLFREDPLLLPEHLTARRAAWLDRLAPATDERALQQARLLLVDIATDGLDPETCTVQSLAVLGMHAGVISGHDALVLESLPDLARAGEWRLPEALLAVLEYAGDDPMVTWQAPFVGQFLQKLYRSHLGIDFQTSWIDLAVILPELFGERGPQTNQFDAWLAHFGIEVPGRLAALPDTLGMARLLQLALAEAAQRGIDTVARLQKIEGQRRWLGR